MSKNLPKIILFTDVKLAEVDETFKYLNKHV